jgi:cytosine deaminase
MDLILQNARLSGVSDLVDIGIKNGNIVAIEKTLSNASEIIDLEGRLVVPPFCETHIHLDKSCILSRCSGAGGAIEDAIREVVQQNKFS